MAKVEKAKLELQFYEDVLGVTMEEVVPGQDYRLMADDKCLIESIKLKQIPSQRLTCEELRSQAANDAKQKNPSKKLVQYRRLLLDSVRTRFRSVSNTIKP